MSNGTPQVNFTKIQVELDNNGEMINISDLPKEQYEKFLELIHALRMAYISISKSNVSY